MSGNQSKKILIVLMLLMIIGGTVQTHLIEATQAQQDVKGIYLNKESMKEENIGSYIDLIDDTNLNTVVMDVKNDAGQLTYESDVNVTKEIGADNERTVTDMKQTVKRLKEAGIYTVARIVVFKDPYLAAQKPEWAIKKKGGGGMER